MAVGAQSVRLLPFSPEALAEAAAAHPGLVVVDYTHPDAVHHNAEARSEAALRLPGAGARRLELSGRRPILHLRPAGGVGPDPQRQ